MTGVERRDVHGKRVLLGRVFLFHYVPAANDINFEPYSNVQSQALCIDILTMFMYSIAVSYEKL